MQHNTQIPRWYIVRWFTARSISFGLNIGVRLGAVYGVLFCFLMLFRSPNITQLHIMALGYISVITFVAGVLFGATLGLISALPLGCLMGSFMGFLSPIFRGIFDKAHYRQLMVATAVLTVSIIGMGLLLLFGFEVDPAQLSTLGAVFDVQYHSGTFDFGFSPILTNIMLFILPAIIASVAAVFISNDLVDWWLAELHTKKIQEIIA